MREPDTDQAYRASVGCQPCRTHRVTPYSAIAIASSSTTRTSRQSRTRDKRKCSLAYDTPRHNFTNRSFTPSLVRRETVEILSLNSLSVPIVLDPPTSIKIENNENPISSLSARNSSAHSGLT